MTKAVRIASVGVAVAGSVVLLQGSLASADPGTSGHGHDDGRVLAFDVQFSPFNLTDVGDPGLSTGDQITFHDVLLVNGTQVGHEVGSCVVADVAGALASCTAVLTVDGQGTITFAFENSPPPRKVIAVTGGSVRYKGVSGDGLLVENGDGTGTLTLFLDDDD